MSITSAKMTYDEYCLLPEDRNRYELIDGELIATPSPTPRHQEIVLALATAPREYVKKNSLGDVYVAPLDTIFNQYTVLQPDIFFVGRERLGRIGEKSIEGVPELAAEVLSPSTAIRDRKKKLAVYSQFGVQEYWIVDPGSRMMEVFERIGKRLETAQKLGMGRLLRSKLFPEFQPEIGEIFK